MHILTDNLRIFIQIAMQIIIHSFANKYNTIDFLNYLSLFEFSFIFHLNSYLKTMFLEYL